MAEFHQGQCASRVKGDDKCIQHRESLKLVCLDCDDLACTECVTSLHKYHEFTNLKDVVPGAKEEITKFINDMEKIESPNMQNAITLAKDILKEDSNHFDHIEKEVSQQFGKLKEDLEALYAKIISSYQQLRQENTDIFTDHIKAVETRQEELNNLMNECKTVLQSGSHVDVYDVRKQLRDLKPMPGTPTRGSASFTPNKQPLDHLSRSFGTVTTHQGQYDILSHTKIVTEFKSPCGISAISTTKDGEVYVCEGYTNIVRSFNKEGEVKQEIEYKVRITDVKVCPNTQHIWTCSDEDCSVMECDRSQSPVLRFNTDKEPTCLCVTKDNCILIGFYKKINKYSTNGTLLLTTDTSHSRQAIVRSPRGIAECCSTGNVAVVDWDYKHVLVMDRNLKEIFCYRGDIPSEYRETIKRRQQTVFPHDVIYDSVGNLVISDNNRGCVHLLSGTGDYLKLIYTGDTELYNIAIDANNVLWVYAGFLSRKVKLMQYTNNILEVTGGSCVHLLSSYKVAIFAHCVLCIMISLSLLFPS